MRLNTSMAMYLWKCIVSEASSSLASWQLRWVAKVPLPQEQKSQDFEPTKLTKHFNFSSSTWPWRFRPSELAEPKTLIIFSTLKKILQLMSREYPIFQRVSCIKCYPDLFPQQSTSNTLWGWRLRCCSHDSALQTPQQSGSNFKGQRSCIIR